jgi:multimeric flavodoxin WrbA
LCSPHRGCQHTGAPLTIDGLSYGDTDDEIVEALNWADGIALMTVVAFAHLAKDEPLRRDADQRLKSF